VIDVEEERQPILIQKEIETILNEEYNKLIEEYSDNILIKLMLEGRIDTIEIDELLDNVNKNIKENRDE